jgi:DNA-binding Xre family transcriptional regulator
MRKTINVDALVELANNKGWKTPDLAAKIGIDYSYLTRIISKEKSGGAKLITGILKLCVEENLNFNDYIFLNNALSVNNGKAESTLPNTG